MKLTGTFTALVTPFADAKVDEDAFVKLVEDQIQAGIDGVVPVGTTGESPTLSTQEHIRVIELAVKASAGRVPVIAGTGANSTAEAVELTVEAERTGADASLQVAPYYNKPGQKGLYWHFKTIAQATRLPIILYSIPGRCGVEIGIETVQQLALECPNIVAIKEAGGRAERVSQLRLALPKSFAILSGDDALTLPFMALGAKGVISVASNIIPTQISQMVRDFTDSNTRNALSMHDRYFPLFQDLFIETNPIPVKTAMAMMGLIREEFRLPLYQISVTNRRKLKETLVQCGLVEA